MTGSWCKHYMWIPDRQLRYMNDFDASKVLSVSAPDEAATDSPGSAVAHHLPAVLL